MGLTNRLEFAIMVVEVEAMKKAFGYLRVSGKGQLEGDGFERQRIKIQEFADANGIEIVQWFEEKGVSGTVESRAALDEMMVAVLSNGVRTVLIEKLDRLARDLMIQESILKNARKEGIEIISAMEPDLCQDDPTRKLMRQILGAFSEYEKTMIVLKLRAARQRKRIKTGRCEGIKRYGQLEGEQTTLARLIDLRASGLNWEGIANKLNSEGLQTRTGGKWYPATVRRIVLKEQTVTA